MISVHSFLLRPNLVPTVGLAPPPLTAPSPPLLRCSSPREAAEAAEVTKRWPRRPHTSSRESEAGARLDFIRLSRGGWVVLESKRLLVCLKDGSWCTGF